MIKLNLTVTINTQRKDKEGRCAIRIRSTINRFRTFYPTGISVTPEQFDEKKKEVVKHPNRVLLNATLRNRMADIESQFIEQNLSGDQSNVLIRNKDIHFKEYAEKLIEKRLSIESKDSIKVKRSRLRKFNGFNSRIKLKDCTPKVLEDFESFCRKSGNTENTVSSTMSFILAVIHSAWRDGTIKTDPSKGFKKARYKDPEREYLTEDEIKKLEDFVLTSPVHTNEANWFLFSCYCGLRFGDLATFNKKEQIVNDKIILRTTKSKTDISIKIHPRLKVVIERLGPNLKSTQKYNDKIKLIAALCGIDKDLTSHIARHTFAVTHLSRGGDIYYLSNLMGHTSIKTTQIYAKITNAGRDAEIDRVWGK